MSTDKKLSKAQIKKIIMSGSRLGSILMRYIPKLIKPATSILKNVAAPLGLSAAMSGTDGAIQRKMHGYGSKSGTTVKFSNEEINDMVNVVKALEDSEVLMKGSTETLKNDVKKGWCFANFTNVIRNIGCVFINWKEKESWSRKRIVQSRTRS